MAYESLDQMYDNILDPIRGWWDERQLSKVCKIDSANPQTVTAGMVGHLTSAGEFLAGIPATTNVLPLFARNNAGDNDVRGVDGNLSGNSGSPTAEAPDQGISTLVGAAAYELASSAVVGTPVVGQPIEAQETSGKLQSGDATAPADMQVGWCTVAPAANYRGTTVVTFITSIWTV